MIEYSELTCPNCGHKEIKKMPLDYCEFFWQCPSCKNVVTPKKGDCCVYCSYGNVPCPSVQKKRNAHT